MNLIGEDPDALDAVLVTHEHSDHVGGLRSLLKTRRSRGLEAFMTCGTIDGCRADSFEMNGSAIVPVIPDRAFSFNDVEIEPFSIPHDAQQPVGFSVRHNGMKVTQLTDLGWIPDDVADAVSASDVLVLESNHDLDMLRMGGYPWSLKERLMGRNGHLSNAAVSQFISERYDGMASNLVLAHLSSRNNHPAIAELEARQALESRGFDGSTLSLASQDDPTVPIEIG